ncbi:MAG: transglutaminase family protein, partial [Methylococcaceae bacterium]|nr:transglutaminase family protein [Methylococcaceae bacterium]
YDFTDLHAWAEVYLPGAGWVGLDPTSGLFASEGHIPLSCTPHPVSAAPITGSTDECEVKFEFSNHIQRIHEDPRVTKPYTEAEWTAINALGGKVDEDLVAENVRLTMGGEPTFVSIDDMDSAQWNIAALGEHKLELAESLLKRLWKQFGPGGVLHFGQGKWYPGEPLPRWALSCFWRKDGKPVWRNPDLIAGRDNNGLGLNQAERFARQLAAHLGVSDQDILPAFEDTLYYLWKESNEPINIDPSDARLDDSGERQRLARLLSGDLRQPKGYVLPLQWNEIQQDWESCAWKFRRQYLFLIPGDSPIGLRLPLDSLYWLPEAERQVRHEQSLFENLPPLSDHIFQDRRQASLTGDSAEVETEALKPNAKKALKNSEIPFITALCFEIRHGLLYVFLPPQTHLEHWLDLIAAIEASATELSLPVRLEGYEPPKDYRLEKLAITPDPGVIEVNIHPARSWAQLVQNTEILYHETYQNRLGTEKFMVDGRHTGTGGGNHVTIGAEKPTDSPLLRRPDVLRSLITYWQHHPGLSFLFSGQFIGPTSQAPRVDEARNENLYELEIAFQQMPEGDVHTPWLVDRLLRNLLVDITGNTHRAEFCIDKLYSPDTAAGRLGLVEFRGFEMPPHARMSLVQMLLLRTLIARFWRKPYNFPLVRWGTALHDRFMLPHYVWADIVDVIKDLQQDGYPFQTEWLKPFLEFRFPHIGATTVQDIQLHLSCAIEPWHVLGEEVGQAGTSRYVDSSLERIQIKATGLTDSRYVITCNGRRAPMRNTGAHGEFVAGIRFRAWQPPSALHPTIGIHSPLVIDIIDNWNGRSIGGCTYHVSHPGGRSYDDYPVNAYAAETRRISRFWGFGHSPGVIQPPPEIAGLGQFDPRGHVPGPMQAPEEQPNPEYPHTLDLRREKNT